MSVLVRLAVFFSFAWLAILLVYAWDTGNDDSFILIGAVPVLLLWGLGWALAAASPRVRRVVLWTAIAGGLYVAGCVIRFRDESEREHLAAMQRVPASDITIEDARLLNNRFTARIRNNNTTYTLNRVDLTITVNDCPELGLDEIAPRLDGTKIDTSARFAACDVVGQSDISIRVNVPPGQARDISETNRLNPQPQFRGTMALEYVITAVKAKT